MEEVGDSYKTLKGDGTRDPTGCENISIVIRSESYVVTECLVTIATTDKGDAQTITDTTLNLDWTHQRILARYLMDLR